MLDLRAMINDRTYLTTFVVGNRYCTVMHTNKIFEEVVEGLETYLGELRKPFVILSSTYIYESSGMDLVDRELVDLVLE
jgi:hypothetical protein